MPYPVRILPTSSEKGPCTRKITSKIKDRQHINSMDVEYCRVGSELPSTYSREEDC